MKGLLYCFLIYVLLVSCSENSQTQLSYLPDKTDKINLTIDTIQVGTPGTIREFPYLYPSFNFSHHVFAGLDERTNSINVYERGSLRITNTIQLNNTGPHAIQIRMIGSMWYQNSDSIFLLQNIPNRLLIINSNAEIVWEKDLGSIFKKTSELNGLMAYALLDKVALYFRNGKAYFGLRQNQAQQDYLNSILGYYDFEKDAIQSLKIQYPEYYTLNDEVGSYRFPSITWYGDSIFIVFPYSPEIFIYDLNGQLHTHIQRPHEFKLGKRPEIGQSRRSHLLSNPLYLGVLPVQSGKYYVMYCQDQTPLDTDLKNYQSTIVYNHDFTEYFVFDTKESPISLGGEYFYYPVPPDQSEFQLLERYWIGVE